MRAQMTLSAILMFAISPGQILSVSKVDSNMFFPVSQVRGTATLGIDDVALFPPEYEVLFSGIATASGNATSAHPDAIFVGAIVGANQREAYAYGIPLLGIRNSNRRR